MHFFGAIRVHALCISAKSYIHGRDMGNPLFTLASMLQLAVK